MSTAGGEIVVAPDAQPQRHVALRLRIEPEAHLRDDPEVRLHEHLVRGGAEAALVDVPGLAARQRAHPGAHHLAVREHDLHAALRGHVLAGREVRGPVVERVADDAAPAEVGARDHQLVPAGLDRLVEVEPAHARLDDRVRELLVDLEHAVHPPQAEDDRAADARRRPAVAVVAAGRVRPERGLVQVGDAHDLLDLLDRLGHDDRRGGVVVPGLEGERVAELAEARLVGEDVLRADGCGEAVECAGGDLGRDDAGHAANLLRRAGSVNAARASDGGGERPALAGVEREPRPRVEEVERGGVDRELELLARGHTARRASSTAVKTARSSANSLPSSSPCASVAARTASALTRGASTVKIRWLS